MSKYHKLTPEELARILREPLTLTGAVSPPVTRALDGPETDGDPAGESRDVPLAFASDLPIEHWWGRVILDMKPESVRLERFARHAPVVWNHSWYGSDPENLLGRLFDVQLGDGMARGTARFSRGAKAEKVLQDIRDGLLESVSVGANLHAIILESEDDDGPVYRATDWEPLEVSFCMVPADISVGVGRTINPQPAPGTPAKTEKTAMPQDGNTTPAGVPPATVTNRDAELLALGERFNARTLAEQFALEGKTEAELRAAILEARRAATAPLPATVPQQQTRLPELSKKEQQQYSVARAILASANQRAGLPQDNCLELEYSDELQRAALRANSAYKPQGGVFLPTNRAFKSGLTARAVQRIKGDGFRSGSRTLAQEQAALAMVERAVQMLQRAGLDTLTDTAGQELVFTEPGSFIDLLRNRAMVLQLGVTMYPGLQGNVAFPKQTGAGTFTWVGENPGSDVAESNLTLDQITLTPKTGQSTTSYSRQLLAQATIDVDALVLMDLAKITALAVDRAAIHGTGSSNQPTGLYAASGVNSVAFGGAITFAKVVDMETAIGDANADLGTMAYLTTTGIRGAAKKTLEFSAAGAKAIWTGGEMNGYRAEASNNVSRVMNGSAVSGGSSHGILFGAWAEYLFGEWGVMEVITDPYAKKKQGMIEVTNFLMIDMIPRYANAFAKGTGLTL